MTIYRLSTLLLFILFCSLPHHTYTRNSGVIAAVSLSISVIGIYGAYKWLRSEEHFKPTIHNLNTLTFKPIHTTQPTYLATPSSEPTSALHAAPISSPNSPIDTSVPHLSIDELVTRINKDKAPSRTLLTSTPTTDANTYSHPSLLVEQGITIESHDPIVFIFSRGYARTNTPGTNDNVLQKGGCAMAAYQPIQDHIINNAPCITFDYPDRRRCFNFGQQKDITCLRFIYEQTLKQHPSAQIILIGDCRGARAILNFAIEQPRNVKALVLLSPFFSAQQLTQEVARNYLSWLPGSRGILQNFFKLWFPSYSEKEDKALTKRLASFNYNIPIFIAHRNHDTLVSTAQVTSFIDHLKITNHTQTHLFITDDTSARHSRLTPVREIQQEVNRFFSTYDLPHNQALLNT